VVKRLWRLAFDVGDAAAAETAAAALTAQCDVLSAFENGLSWRVEGLSRDKPDVALVEAALALLWRESEAPLVTLDRLPPRDWLRENQAAFPPLRAGRFFVHGSHYRGAVPRDAIPILIDAATAFGTGEHATTRGCLLALEMMARRPRQILDMGCGTGILAIAAARSWRVPVLACDIDPEAVRVTRINARRNHMTRFVRAENATGYRHREIARRGPFDLVFANILARPLIAMAPDLARVLAPGGVAILSGLLARQETAVLAAHRVQGLYLRGRIALEGWHTLVVAKRGM
jgi:ribosomal protein L11 methyltransferase